MDNMTQIAIITSIAPKGIENQRGAIDSWLLAGFKVISFNCSEEIDIIRPFFPEVEFIEAKIDARQRFGKPYVYITDIMKLFLSLPYEVCGIINSDIYIINFKNGLYQYIIEQSKGSLIFVQRTDIDSLDSLYGSLCLGYDCFFFDKKIAEVYGNEEFCMGQPAWDYWIIIAAAINNVEVKKLLNPIAYHIRHPLNWDVKTGSEFKKAIYEKYIDKPEQNLGDYSGAVDREYGRLVFHFNREILYLGDKKEPSVLIVYDAVEDVDINDTATYKSIVGQEYKNYRIIRGRREDIDISKVTESFIYFIHEGSIVNKHFLSLMVDSAAEFDCTICGLKVINNQNLSVNYVYPAYKFDVLPNSGQSIDDFILYRTEALRILGDIRQNHQSYKIRFIAEGLVESVVNKATVLFSEEKYETLIKKYEACSLPEVLYYLGISYIKTNRSEKGLDSLLEFFDSINNFSIQTNLNERNLFYMNIFDEVADNGMLESDKGNILWNKLREICLINDTVRFRILFLLFKNKNYKKIISLCDMDNPETNFYVGRACKDLKDYDKSMFYLKRYIDFIELWNGNQLTPIYNYDFIVSAYYHLGEIYYLNRGTSAAKRCFEKCRTISHDTHLKAKEYLKLIG